MNGKKAKALRKLASFSPSFPRNYMVKEGSERTKSYPDFSRVTTEGLPTLVKLTTNTVELQHGARKHYKALKKGITNYLSTL